MRTRIIIVKSITHAMKGQKLLSNNRISSSLERNAKAVGLYGCGYGLRVSVKDVDRAVQILNASGIKITDIFD
ncbi:MAG: putative Se/S carrier-like protein [Oscillospiraceae bacterium]